MTKILFVCHGNICRSPMAEFMLKDMVEKKGIADDFYIASAATSTEEIWGPVGNPVYPPARDELKKHGISCEGKNAVQVKRSDYDKYDLLLCMDRANIRNTLRIIRSDPDDKLKLLMDYTSRPRDVADPWYTGDFVTAYQDIYEGLEGLLNKICCT